MAVVNNRFGATVPVRRRHLRIWLSVAGALLVLAGGGLGYWWPRSLDRRLYYMGYFWPGSSYMQFLWARVFQAVGFAFLFIPINTVAFSDLPPTASNNAAAIINLSRNIGGSIGILSSPQESRAAGRRTRSRSLSTSHRRARSTEE